MVIEITEDKCLCDEGLMQDYVDVLNGIVYDCMYGGFSVGYRNQIAVDLAVAAYMLGLDAIQVLDWLVKYRVIDLCNDDEDTYRRVETVLDYKNRFDWDYMIAPNYYVNLAHEHADEIKVMLMPVQFIIFL